jgi:hypothetical protein
LDFLMPGFVNCAGVNCPLTEAESVTELWDVLGTGTNVEDAAGEAVIADPSWKMVSIQQESDTCSEEVRPTFNIRLFCVSRILSTWVTLG